MTRPFLIRDDRELSWIKDWFKSQILDGRLPVDLRRLALVNTQEDALRLINDELDGEDRVRLQKALSARRVRATQKRSKVVTELDREARDMLLAVAAHRGTTTSELIKTVIGGEYERIQ